MNVLVTGGAGYIGSHSCKALAEAGHVPVAFDNLSRGNAASVKWGTLVKGDIGDCDLLVRTMTHYSIDAVMHFAGYAYVGESMSNPDLYFSNNSMKSLVLLEAMRISGVGHIIFSSSCATYGVPDSVPIDECQLQRPINPYGDSKLFVERLLHWYEKAFGINWVALRYFNASGADGGLEIGEFHRPETHLIPLAVEASVDEGSSLSVFGTDFATVDGTAVRDYVHVSDLAVGHVLALNYLVAGKRSRAFNLGSGTGTSVREVLNSVWRCTGRQPKVIYEPRRGGDPPVLIADASAASKELGWCPTYRSIDEIVATAVSWYSVVRSRGW